MTEEAIREMAKALYDRASDETWCDENPSSLKSVWVDGEVDFISLAEAAIAAWNRRAGGEREQQLEALFHAAKPIFDDVQKTVAGWQRDPTLPRHPDTLGWTPSKSNCRVAYAIADALAALAGQTEGERNGG